MANYNRVILAGRLTHDPEVRYTPSGTAVADIGLAVSDSYKNKSGELVEQTCYVDVVVWGRQAETTGEYLHKGSPVLIEGKLQLDQWENQQGEKRSKLRVRADRVQFLESRRDSGGGGDDDGPRGTDSGAREPAPGTDDPAGQDDENLPF
jgi:single-strand DNA-binding protein